MYNLNIPVLARISILKIINGYNAIKYVFNLLLDNRQQKTNKKLNVRNKLSVPARFINCRTNTSNRLKYPREMVTI